MSFSEWRPEPRSSPHRAKCRPGGSIRFALWLVRPDKIRSLGILAGGVFAELRSHGQPLKDFNAGLLELLRLFAHSLFQLLVLVLQPQMQRSGFEKVLNA